MPAGRAPPRPPRPRAHRPAAGSPAPQRAPLAGCQRAAGAPALGSSWEAFIQGGRPRHAVAAVCPPEAPPPWTKCVAARGQGRWAGCRLGFCCPRQRPDHRLITRVQPYGWHSPRECRWEMSRVELDSAKEKRGVWREKAGVRCAGGVGCAWALLLEAAGSPPPLAGSCCSVWLLLPPQSRALCGGMSFMS